MREFQHGLQKKNYYMIISVIIVLMVLGVVVDNPFDSRFVIHGGMVFIVAFCLLLYPLYENAGMRYTTIIASTVYFYSLFYLYPETWSEFILLCFVPALSILFFDKRLFYFSLVLNSLFIGFTFSYIAIVDQGQTYLYIYADIAGNVVNFFASQIILYFIFHLTNVRIQKQRMYYEQVQQAERLKTTGQMAAAVAHEIRNPLTVVKGFLQYYEADPELNQSFKKNFSLMINELHTAEHVISQFLAIAKPDEDKMKDSVGIDTVLNDVTELLKSYGMHNDNSIELSVEEGCFIIANPIEIKQLFINLIKNAIEASPHSKAVSVAARKKKGVVRIEVMDHGRGMSSEELKNLGTPFYSLKSKGTGLGLMICYNIVEKYGGTIKFESAPGVGTKVAVQFPMAH
ncbi:ATP-binding protein [Rossellomorea sp. NS-SX7]|uniref:ATP-binding protein n=1 Tax=Rossellomorea sp. NS-SX7 TaxID=3463856 RepID=UPI004058556F